MSKWDKTASYLESKIKGFEIKEKEGVWHQMLIDKVLFFMPFMKFWSALYPKVWRPAGRGDDYTVLQHEGVHLLDAQSFYGLLPVWPVLKWFNVALFAFCYATPQIFFLLALHVFVSSPLWIFYLLFLLPLPSPGRMIAEMRAYRRSRELGRDVENMLPAFVTSKYFYMWPFKNHIRKLLMKDSPYKEEMDKILE